MEARIVREELQKCHKAEGVNHYQVCNELAKKYHSLLADAKVSSRNTRVQTARFCTALRHACAFQEDCEDRDQELGIKMY